MPDRVPLFTAERSILLICDLQEKFRPAVKYFPQIVETTNKLLQACKILDIPYVVTEQYPKGLGRTVPELEIGDTKIFEKTSFSMCTPELLAHVQTDQLKGRNTVIICGIEAHACVLQTALDFILKGYIVYVVIDAVSSRSLTDRTYAFEHMRQAGAYLLTFETIVLQLTRDASHPKFKQIQQLIRIPTVDFGLVPLSNFPNSSL